jgi:hypothetical protein
MDGMECEYFFLSHTQTKVNRDSNHSLRYEKKGIYFQEEADSTIC